MITVTSNNKTSNCAQNAVSWRSVGTLAVRTIASLWLFTTLALVAPLTAVLAQETAVNEGDQVLALSQFIAGLERFEAKFEQTLYDASAEPLRVSKGTVRLQRPAQIRWEYTEPVPQLIVADGERIWLYDEDLAQVTVYRLDRQINGTPLQFLMQSAPVTDAFAVEPLGMADGIEWYALTPLDSSSDFDELYIGIRDTALAALELRDSFGQATQIVFSEFNRDVALDDQIFQFEVPEGVDVIGNGQ